MTDRPPQVLAFQERRLVLAQLAARLAAAFVSLGSDSRAAALSRLESKLASERFKILVVGEVNRGKSSLINALLGEKVLPVDILPCTAVIQEVHWGEARRAILHFRQPLPSPMPEALPPDEEVHLSLAESDQVPPLEVPVDRLEEYAAIRGHEGGQETPYSKIEILWPLPLCRDGIDFLDSPGFNEDRLRSRVTREHIPEADAVLFVLSCTLLGAATEMRLVDRDLRELGFEHLFFVCNRLDEIPPADRARLTAFGRKKLAGYTHLGQSGVWFVSALQALAGKLDGDMARLAESGLPSFERALLEFLHRDRGRIKLLQPTLKLLHAIDELRNQVLPEQCEMLVQSLAVLESKAEAARPQLAEVERSNSHIVAELEGRRQELRSEVRTLAAGFLHELAGRIAGWINSFELENSVRTLSLEYRQQVEALAREICAKLGSRLETEVTAWITTSLVPLVNSRLDRMMHDTSLRVDEASFRVDQIRSTVTQVRSTLHAEEPSEPERITAAMTGLAIAGFYSGAHGARFGFKGLGDTILTQIALYAILYGLLGVTNPLILLPAMLGTGFVGAWSRAGALTRRAKREVASALAAQVHGGIDAAAQGLADAVSEKIGEHVKRTRARLDHEVSGLREQMRTILEDKRAGEERVRTRKELLVRLDRELREIDSAFTPLLAAALAEHGSSLPSTAPAVPKATSEPTRTIRILFLAADPFDSLQNRLRLDCELREIREQKSLARFRDSLDLRSELAVRPRDVTRALQEYEPQIVHFSGHRDEDGILVEGPDGRAHPITAKALASLFELFAGKVQCVILNACHSDLDAAAVSQKIPFVVGMRRAVRDQAAISFSVGFYQALGAGRPIEECFAAGCVLVGMEADMEASHTPVLWKDGKAVRASAL
jgi:GTPase SAR1 family protein